MIDTRSRNLRERQPPQPRRRVIGRQRPLTHLCQQLGKLFSVHQQPFYPPRPLVCCPLLARTRAAGLNSGFASTWPPVCCSKRAAYPAAVTSSEGSTQAGEALGTLAAFSPQTRVGYMGPHGTFTEQALLSQHDLAAGTLVPFNSIPDVLTALDEGTVDMGFVPIENAIEGAVNVTQDTLAFDLDLLVQREVVMSVQLDLMGVAAPGNGGGFGHIHTVVSFPVALAQCRGFLHQHLPDAEIIAATSTADAARRVGTEQREGVAAIANPRAAELYGLTTLAEAVEDHRGNQTRFFLLARGTVPTPTGHDKTSIVVFQRSNEPGSLLGILGEFAARQIDLSRLESRPTRRSLGDYCFLLDFEGHICDEVVADCLRDLKMKQSDVKFLGSYPAAGEPSPSDRRPSEDAWRNANNWIGNLRSLATP